LKRSNKRGSEEIVREKLELLSDSSRQRRELREFLRARRALLKPEECGLRSIGRRRAPGLRREEVASLAGVGLTWYTWLEQGRDIHVSGDMLGRIAKTLKLSPHDRTYLFSLAGHHPPEVRASVKQIDPAVQLALDGFTAGPAWVLNAQLDAVAFNGLADAIYRFDDYDGPLARNMVWRGFMDPRRRRLYVDWTSFVMWGVGFLRATYATRIGDVEFETLLKTLLTNSSEFERFWNDSRRTGTSSLAPSEVRLRIPGYDILRFVSVRLTLPACPGHFMGLISPLDRKGVIAMTRMAEGLRDHQAAG
jgi:hypothetical protein